MGWSKEKKQIHVKLKLNLILLWRHIMLLLLFMSSPCGLGESQSFFLILSPSDVYEIKRPDFVHENLWTRVFKWMAQDLCFTGSIFHEVTTGNILWSRKEKNLLLKKGTFLLSRMKRPVQEVFICANTDFLLDKVSVKNELNTEIHSSSLGGKKDREDTE